MHKVGALVFEWEGAYFITMGFEEIPETPAYTNHVFSLLREVHDTQEIFDLIREEANRRGIGNIINMPS